MKLQHIELEHLKTTNLNVRKKGAKSVDDLLPSIRSLGVLQPLLVRLNCEGFEIIAGQRRYHAACKLAENGNVDPLPCIIMQEGDDAKAIEASLAENIARLPMDEIDQYKAFSALVKQGSSVDEIANQFGITERLVKQRLAIANLIAPVLTLYRKEEITADTVRNLTLANKRQQKAWLSLYQSDDEYAPQGYRLKAWLFGGEEIPVSNALFDLADYIGGIVSDLFGEDSYFDDANTFWESQNTEIAQAKTRYIQEGWSDVIVLDVGTYWSSWEYSEVSKAMGGKVFVQIARDGEVTFHEGFLTQKEAKKLENKANGIESEKPAERPELTKLMQNYLDLHRHAAVRYELLGHAGIALRLAVAQIIAGSELWSVHADLQLAKNESIQTSLEANRAEDRFSEKRATISRLLGMEDTAKETLVPRNGDWDHSPDLYVVFAKLLKLSDEDVTSILTFVVAETLPAGSAIVEVLGNMFKLDMSDHWQSDDIFFDLLRDKPAINAIVKEVAGKATADAHVTSTAKVQKKIIADCLDGTRKGSKVTSKSWKPNYMDFPMTAYTKRGGINAMDNWNAVRKHFA